MNPNQLVDLATALSNLVNRNKIKGAILITFEDGQRSVLCEAKTEDMRGELMRTATEIHNKLSDKSIAISPVLN